MFILKAKICHETIGHNKRSFIFLFLLILKKTSISPLLPLTPVVIHNMILLAQFSLSKKVLLRCIKSNMYLQFNHPRMTYLTKTLIDYNSLSGFELQTNQIACPEEILIKNLIPELHLSDFPLNNYNSFLSASSF